VSLLHSRLAFAAALALPAAVFAQHLPTPDVSALAIPADQPTSPGGRIAPQLLGAKGQVQVWVQLQDEALASASANANSTGLPMTREAQRAYLAGLSDKHDDLSRVAQSLGGRELGRVGKAHNAVAFSIDAALLPALAAHPGVLTVRPVVDYSVDLSSTVPYIGATAVQNLGVTGKGVRVAVLDTGIDYTHRNMKGSGTATDYTAAFGTSLNDPRNTTVNPALFPTDKVVGGFDFLGEHWPQPDGRPLPEGCGKDAAGNALVCLRPDPNPIACGGVGSCDGTHGTHVADIIGGLSRDGSHKGVAPGTQLYAVKVCSSVSSSCSGVGLLQAMDFALDPNGGGTVSDAVDVINMSLGSNYGQKEDDLTQASENAVRLGVVVATAAGNAGDKPYIVSSPSVGPGVISVAQTQVPSAKFFPLVVNSPAAIAGSYNNTATVDWAPIGSGFTGDVAIVGRGCPANSGTPTGAADPYLANPAGKVALIDRGACAVSLKVDRAAKAGAIGVLIGLVAGGDAISFSFGGGTQMAPTLVIIQADSTRIKRAAQPVNVTVKNSSPLVGSLASTSARGPSYSYQTIKPEIGAPGASVSAVAGTGTGEAAFGGTSGATPMVAGSAALLLEAFKGATPAEIKARLMNSSDTHVLTAPNLFGNQLAPATRIGAGELRVDRALAARTLAFVAEDESAAISFGYAAIASRQEFRKRVQVFNPTKTSRTYAVAFSFRDAANPGVAAVSAGVPSSIQVPARGMRDFEVRIAVDPTKLQGWILNGGSQGGNGQRLTQLELDGHVTLSDKLDSVSLPWSLIAHRAADVRTEQEQIELASGTGSVRLDNPGATAGRVEAFAWTGSSKKIAKRLLPKPGDNFAVIDLGQVGVRSAGSGDEAVVQFGINTFGKRSHPNYPAEFDISVDFNRDGIDDFVIFNAENGGFGASGQNVVFLADLRPCPGKSVRTDATVKAFFFADADLNSGRMIMTVPLPALAPVTVGCREGKIVTPVALPGLTATAPFNFSVFAFDNYFTGNLTDSIENMTFTLATPRFTASGVPATGVPVGGSSILTVTAVAGGDAASPSQKGLLLLYRDAAKREAQTIRLAAERNDG
jgi:subtilisin family serine protease